MLLIYINNLPSNSNNSKSSNSSNNNNQQQSIEFMNEKWALEEKCFTDTFMPPVKVQDRETKRTRWIRKPWPRIKPIEQRGFESFYSKIIDPATGKPYEQIILNINNKKEKKWLRYFLNKWENLKQELESKEESTIKEEKE